LPLPELSLAVTPPPSSKCHNPERLPGAACATSTSRSDIPMDITAQSDLKMIGWLRMTAPPYPTLADEKPHCADISRVLNEKTFLRKIGIDNEAC